MVLESQESKVRYQGNDLATEWPVPFPLLREEHLHLIVTDANGLDTLIDSNYEIKGIKEENVSVTYPVEGEPLASGHRLTIYREIPLVQLLDLENGGNFNAEVIERQFDNTVMQIQQIQEQIDRSIKVSISSEEIPKTAEDIYNQVNLIADRAEEAVAQSEASAALAVEGAETASGYADLVHKWAANPEDEPVEEYEDEDGNIHRDFSAKHYASKAQKIVFEDLPLATPELPGIVPSGGASKQVYMVSDDGTEYVFSDLDSVVEQPLASPVQDGLVPAGGLPGQVFGVSGDGQSYGFFPDKFAQYTFAQYMFPGQFFDWYSPQLPPFGLAANGAKLVDAENLYPQLWDSLLNNPFNSGRVISMSDWMAKSNIAGGIGGVPEFAIDLNNKIVQLPDLRGDYERMAGGGTMLKVGDWHDSENKSHVHTLSTQGNNVGTGYARPPGGNGGTIHSPSSASIGRQGLGEARTRTIGKLKLIYIGVE